jgi:hypothetical protein
MGHRDTTTSTRYVHLEPCAEWNALSKPLETLNQDEDVRNNRVKLNGKEWVAPSWTKNT